MNKIIDVDLIRNNMVPSTTIGEKIIYFDELIANFLSFASINI